MAPQKRLPVPVLLLAVAAVFLAAASGLAAESSGATGLLRLKAGTFDPSREEAPVPAFLRTAEGRSAALIVRLDGPVVEPEIRALEAAGARPLKYVPDHAYIVRVDPADLAKVRALPFVTWAGPSHPGYKIAKDLFGAAGTVELNVKLLDASAGTAGLAAAARALGAEVVDTLDEVGVLQLRGTPDLAYHLSFSPEVEWIERAGEKRLCMNNIRILSGASTVHAGGYDGSGVVGEVCEDGYDRDHYEFAGQILAEDGNVLDNASHGTCTFGIIFAKGIDGNALGMLPGAQGVFADWDIGRWQSISNLYNNWGGLFKSNSWMITAYYGDYTTYSQQNDQAIYDYDHVSMLYAAGNYGNEIATDSAAKNVICVGALNHYNNLNWADDTHTSAQR